MSYESVMSRRSEIMKCAVGIDFQEFESGGVAFDYERMMEETGYSLSQIQEIQRDVGVGNTPLYELKNISRLSRLYAAEGKGARIFLKDEASNPSGSFKARRAATSCHHAKKLGYKGVIAATSGNYGAAVASQAAMLGLKCIIIQECYDSRGIGQPEIMEKARACEAYGAEVIQLTVGPELFYSFLRLLEETRYFNASLYTPFAIAGVETLGYELAMEFREREGRDPDVVVVTNAGGGNLTGTARGLIKAGAIDTKVVAASVNLQGLHMASDNEFNKKSFTTGHTGFGIPYASWPDRSDVPRSAARPLRYMDRYVVMNQGSVFYMTELLAQLEGLERGPAGNTALVAAFKLAQEMDQDEIIVVQETEYTGAGKHLLPQLTFAKENGVKIMIGNPLDEIPGENIIFPKDPQHIELIELDIDNIKTSYIKNTIKNKAVEFLTKSDLDFLCQDTKSNIDFIKSLLEKLEITYEMGDDNEKS